MGSNDTIKSYSCIWFFFQRDQILFYQSVKEIWINPHGNNQACSVLKNSLLNVGVMALGNLFDYKYGQTCIKRSPLGLRKSGLIVIRQVAS